MAEREEELKSLLMKLREEREKEKKRLKTQHSNNEDHGIWSRHVTVNRWGNNANSERLSFLGLQNHCRWWLQLLNWKILAPWKKSYDKCRQHIKNQRHHFADKGPLSQKLCFFPLVVCWCESWTIKKAEHQRIDTFELWPGRRPLRVHWTTRRSNQSILKEFDPEYSLESLILKLKLQDFVHLKRRIESLEKTLILGRTEGRRGGRWQWMR